MSMGSGDLSPVAEKVLKFSIDKDEADGLRYEDYMEGLGTVLSGISISQLSIALHQLETKGYLHPDPHGTPNRKIRVTALGKQVFGGKPMDETEPTVVSPPVPPQQASAADHTLPVSSTVPAPLPSEPEAPSRSAGESKPLPGVTDKSGTIDVTDEIRRRLRTVIEREEQAKANEDKHRLKERELLDEEERLAILEKDLEQRRKNLEERERQATEAEDQLHDHITNLKGHLAGVSQVTENVHKLHEKVTTSRQRRQRSS